MKDIKTEQSIFYKIVNGLFRKLFSIKIGGKFGELLKSSVLLNLVSHYEYGVYAMILLAPIVPTMVCAGIAIFTYLMFFINSIIKNDMEIKFDFFGIITITLLGIFLGYSVTSYARIDSLKVFAMYFIFISFMFMTMSAGSDKKNLRKMIFLFALSGLFVSAYGIYQQFFGDNLGHAWLDEEMFEDISVRVYSTLENPNVLGEYLLLVIPICGAMIYGAKKWYSKLFYLGVLGSAGLCLIFTQSRGCWLGLMLCAVVFALLIDKRLVLLGIVALLFLPMLLPESIITRFTSIGNMEDSSTSYRVYIWLGTIRMLKDYWWNGIGLGEGAFTKVYPYYSYNAISAPHAHNLYLQLISATGIAGLVTFITSMLIGLKKILVGYIVGKKSIYGYLCASIIAGLLGFLLQGMFDYVWYNYRVFLIFWMFIGIGIASRRCACEEDFTHNKWF